MKERNTLSFLLAGASLVALLLLLVVVVQLNALEKRVIVQNQQLRSLGENTERLSAAMTRLKAGGLSPSSAETSDCPVGQLLHPEVENAVGSADYSYPPGGAALDGVFHRGWASGDPKGFNWMVENAADLTGLVINYTDTALAERNKWTDPGKWHGSVACRVEITDDYKEYTFYLRRGIKWHTPAGVDLSQPKFAWLKGDHELTAHDFEFTFDMMMNPQVENGFLKNYYEDLESWKAVDDYTFVLRWKKKTYNSISFSLGAWALPKFLYAYSEAGEALPKETIGLRFNQHWYNNKGYVGVGPYRFVSYRPGQSIELERNDDYFGLRPAIQRVVYPIYNDPNQTVLRMKAKELDFAGLQPGQYREEVLQWEKRPKSEWPKNSPFLNGEISCEVVPEASYFFIGWNADRPLFADARVRTAMTLALRRQEIVDRVFAGLGEVASGPFLPESGNLNPNVDPLHFDLDRARQLLSDAGWTDSDGDGLLDKVINGKKVPFSFTLLIYGSSPEYAAMSNIFKDDLLKLGVKLEVDAAEWSLMQKKMDEKQFDAFSGGWALPWESDPYQIWHSSQADTPKGSNRVGFRNPQADALIEKLRETFDQDERKQLLREIHTIIYEEQAYTFLFRRKRPYCWRSTVHNVVFAKDRPADDLRPWYSTRVR